MPKQKIEVYNPQKPQTIEEFSRTFLETGKWRVVKVAYASAVSVHLVLEEVPAGQ